ncbi:MAG: deoxyhypusine synthase, partial [Gemmatimonadetes bacterium]|nr:deoxyhypusine synthase [Gemmatimonadota bacterium]
MTVDRKRALLARPVEHIDVTGFDGRAVVDSYRNAAFQARNLAEAADIFAEMIEDRRCPVILTLAGSLVSAGLKEALITLIECNMADVVVATGAVVVDQDFFEALGFRHYMAPGSPEAPSADDEELRALGIDRIYDTYVDETDLQRCDATVAGIFDGLEARPWSSRELMRELGAYLERHHGDARSILLAAHRKEVPVFVPALSDSSAGFGVVAHRARAGG